MSEFTRTYAEKEEIIGSDALREAEKGIMLQVLDTHWKDHLSAMDHMRQGIQLRGYAQKNPTQEFKRESFNMFTSLLENIKYALISMVSKIQVATPEMISQSRLDMAAPQLHFSHEELQPIPADLQQETVESDNTVLPFVRQAAKVGRNDVCDCGSGKKYKLCHGRFV